MSLFRNSPLRASFSTRRRQSNTSPPKDCDPTACYVSFKEHWQQASDIIERTQVPDCEIKPDDVSAVVNHLNQMTTLLLVELHSVVTKTDDWSSQQCCLDFLLCENVLERLFEWSKHTGRFYNVLRREQLKLYELLACQARQQLLLHQPFLRPMLCLLASYFVDRSPVDGESHLVVLLNQLCVCLMNNTELLQLFFHSGVHDQGPARFLIFSLLIPFIHREGSSGQQARDALLLCMALSKEHEEVGKYIVEESTVCPVLATGLNALYSRLPRKLRIETEDWHRLTPDDVKDIEELATFMNSLEFCNAVAQVAHANVRQQLLDFLYQGFLVPVLGPALLQDSLGLSLERLDSPEEVSTRDELVAATAYLDLCLRSVSEPGLLRVFVRFLLRDKYDGERILDRLVQRLYLTSRLGLVSLALFDSLVGLNCEDVMLELVFKHLVPCTHVMLSQRCRVRDVDAYGRSAEKLLSLSPACCLTITPAPTPVFSPPNSMPPMPFSRRSTSDQQLCSLPTSLYGRITESLYGNYHAYLCDARRRIMICAKSCQGWTYRYDGEDPPHENVLDGSGGTTVSSGAGSLSGSSGYESLAARRGSSESGGEGDSSGNANVASHGGHHILNRRQTSRENSYLEIFNTKPDIGPFLNALLHRLKMFHNNGLYVNLQLTGLISRLACYPQPLLHSFLLNQSLVFQPSILSLFQVLSTLKHKTDMYLADQSGVDYLVNEAQNFLVSREEKLVNARRLAQEVSPAASNRRTSLSVSDNFSRNEPKRRSITLALTSVFKRTTQPAILEAPTRENRPEGAGTVSSSQLFSKQQSGSAVSQLHNYVLQAVLLDEWLKELAAITQEQAVANEMREL